MCASCSGTANRVGFNELGTPADGLATAPTVQSTRFSLFRKSDRVDCGPTRGVDGCCKPDFLSIRTPILRYSTSLCDDGVLTLQIYNIDGAVVGVIVILGYAASQKLVDCEMEHFCP